jgi:ketosteroid isomerase-like protein
MRGLLVALSFLTITNILPAQAAPSGFQTEITAFNRRLEDATKRMNTAEVMALWAEDGISLLPSTSPLVGKAAIAVFLDKVTAQLQNAKMETLELQCSPAEGDSNWATEWCDEHQVVLLPGGKPPFDGRGRMLFVLHKQSDGIWKIEREMWQPAG